jgi:DNA (cytosine-5)-methyltransferase 1
MNKLKLLDLFSGIGGFSLGLERTGGFETVAFCEIEEFPRKVLAKHWPEVPQYEDIRDLTASRLAADGLHGIEAISAGFPCQDISAAGKKAGAEGERSGLWHEIVRLVSELQPSVIILENSAELLNRGLGDILGELASRGYDAEWQCISAASLGAPHGRDRIWIVAYPNKGSQSGVTRPFEAEGGSSSRGDVCSDTECGLEPLGRVMERAGRLWQSPSWDGIWEFENSPLGMGVDDGLPARLDRLRALGNSVVPQIPELIGNAYLESIGWRAAA